MHLKDLIATLEEEYPSINFEIGESFLWSPKERKVFFSNNSTEPRSTWSLLHEVSHAILGHSSYQNDFELLKIEVAAWEKAKEISKNHNIEIDDEYIQDCIDTYRDWLHMRSSCPSCDNASPQLNSTNYKCFNCGESWTVTESRLCRPYRLKSAV